MALKDDVLALFAGEARERPMYMPDLTLWYDWHQRQGTLPERWRDCSLPQIARAMGVPIWLPMFPGRMETPGVEIVSTERGGERVTRYETVEGTLIAGWTLGPEGDWWQTEYPVKSEVDLVPALEIAKARSYVLDASDLQRRAAEVGADGVVALKLPRRPYSDVLHDFLGWSEGLLYLRHPLVGEIVAILEEKLQRFVQRVAQLPGQLVLSPDNLDGQFISPRAFRKDLAESYRRTTDVLHQNGKRLVVHIGGPIQHLAKPLSEAGVDCLEGVAGPPQSDLSLRHARELTGPGLTLWGGIAQDFLPGTREVHEFEDAIVQAVREARSETRVILGVADRVPVDAELDRLEAIPTLVERAWDEGL